jgi:hypothetical protein
MNKQIVSISEVQYIREKHLDLQFDPVHSLANPVVVYSSMDLDNQSSKQDYYYTSIGKKR